MYFVVLRMRLQRSKFLFAENKNLFRIVFGGFFFVLHIFHRAVLNEDYLFLLYMFLLLYLSSISAEKRGLVYN